MHQSVAEAAVNQTDVSPVSFLWLELTNRCNLKCSHCYADSGPDSSSEDTLRPSDYEYLIAEAAEIGCRQIQFIGGEPTLNHDLPHFIATARKNKYEFVEVFTNLTRLDNSLFECFKTYGVHVATSVYAPVDNMHDTVTGVRGSFRRTVKNIKTLVDANIPVRAGIVEMEQNSGQSENTIQFLKDMGVEKVGTDRLRSFGRGSRIHEKDRMTELCGSCAGRTLCVAPNGNVSPCIMAKTWTIGSIRENSLRELANSEKLLALRKEIYSTVVVPQLHDERVQAQCDPHKPCFPCGPDVQCYPCQPNTNCGPNQCRPYCMPNPG
jgi:radical SAM protein with 4Fe4S-binding SPASM domain